MLSLNEIKEFEKINKFEKFFDEDKFFDVESNGVVKGLQIMQKYIPSADIEGAEHDLIYSVSVKELVKAGITEDDVVKLRNLGWHIHGGEYMAKYV